ncbi:MAG: GIY-YIG nuclease family protein [Octadecabacter sp.]|nr:GIY-YIG nuclease family protein [Octadecabacter sp.]
MNDILSDAGVEPRDTVILLHTPREAKLARLLPFLVEAEPDFFTLFQSSHSPQATATMRGRAYVASFVRVESGTLAFTGIHRNLGVVDRPMAEIAALPQVRRLMEDFGAYQEFRTPNGRNWPWFDLEPTELMGEYFGRLQIQPRLTPAYARLAENLDAQVVALSQASVLSPAPPNWRHFLVSGPEIRALPLSWATRLSDWRGIYLIVDESDGARYVGSAYGTTNLLGRWRTHVANDVGVTAQLRLRNTVNFRFSILERVSPDMSPDDVIALERTWMDRLHTIEYGLNT